MFTLARASSLLSALVWLLGLSLVGLSGALFTSDSTYFWFGAVTAFLGICMAPVAVAYTNSIPSFFGRAVSGLGIATCLALILTGALLLAGSEGWLGDHAPSWILPVSDLPLAGFCVWVLLASSAARAFAILSRTLFWLGLLTTASFLLPIAVFFLAPDLVITDTTIPFFMIASLFLWFSLPAWLIAFALHPRPSPSPVVL